MTDRAPRGDSAPAALSSIMREAYARAGRPVKWKNLQKLCSFQGMTLAIEIES
jgi:hypothetical protein